MALITRKILRQVVWFMVGLVVVVASALGVPALQASATVPSAALDRPSDLAEIVEAVPEALDTWNSHLQANFYQ